MNSRSPRRGYAMLLVLVFLAVALSLYSLSYRHTAVSLRVDTARTLRNQRDEGSVHALALGLALLETGLPPSDPYDCAVEIDTSDGARSFTVTFTQETDRAWSVRARPTERFEYPDRMPDSFAEEPGQETTEQIWPGNNTQGNAKDKNTKGGNKGSSRGKNKDSPKGKNNTRKLGLLQIPHSRADAFDDAAWGLLAMYMQDDLPADHVSADRRPREPGGSIRRSAGRESSRTWAPRRD